MARLVVILRDMPRVRGFQRKDGTKVRAHNRRSTQSGERRGANPDAAAAAAIAAEVSAEIVTAHATAVTDAQAHAGYAQDAADITEPLAETRMAVAHDRSNSATWDDVLRMLSDAPDGFTHPPDGSSHTPEAGYAVTVQGTDYRFSPKEAAAWATEIDSTNPVRADDDTAAEAQRNDLIRWLDRVRPLLDSRHAWIGGWYNEAKGTLEVNVSLVIDEKYRDEAVKLGRDWDQHGIWDFADGSVIETGGSGRATLYHAANPVWAQLTGSAP